MKTKTKRNSRHKNTKRKYNKKPKKNTRKNRSQKGGNNGYNSNSSFFSANGENGPGDDNFTLFSKTIIDHVQSQINEILKLEKEVSKYESKLEKSKSSKEFREIKKELEKIYERFKNISIDKKYINYNSSTDIDDNDKEKIKSLINTFNNRKNFLREDIEKYNSRTARSIASARNTEQAAAKERNALEQERRKKRRSRQATNVTLLPNGTGKGKGHPTRQKRMKNPKSMKII